MKMAMPLHSQKRPPSNSVLESKVTTERSNRAELDERGAENFDDDGGVLAISVANLTPKDRYEFWNRTQFRSTKAESIDRLTGKVLIQEVKRYAHLPKREIAKQCGYVIFKNNRDQIDLAGFYDAVLAAKGLNLDPGNKVNNGFENSYRATVSKNGQIVINSTCTSQMGLTEGAEFEIKIGYKHIHLIQIDRK
jgi:hypothetical protein